MQLYVMRHGPSEDISATGRDEDRKLTPAGRVCTRLVAQELRRREAYPTRILSSPLRRAVETAEEVAAHLVPEVAIEVRPELAPGIGGSLVLADLMSARAGRVLLVGHEPDLSQLTSGLVAEWTRAFAKSMVIALRIDVGEEGGDRFAYPDAQMEFVIDPQKLC
jgi:phosphohistidine phosphatase